MSYSTSGTTTYANIDDLPEITSISDGDKIILQTDSGTSLLDYYNFKIDLQHTSFQSTFEEMMQFTGNAESIISEINDEFSVIKEDFESIKTSFKTMNYDLEGATFLLQSIVGAWNDETSWKSALNGLSSEARTYVNEKINEINAYLTAQNDGTDYNPDGNVQQYYKPYERNLMRASLTI